jgi:hypothetical protein
MTQLRHCRSIIVHCAGLICTPSYEDRRALSLARAEEENSIVRSIDALDDADLGELIAYAATSGKRFEQKRSEALANFLTTN